MSAPVSLSTAPVAVGVTDVDLTTATSTVSSTRILHLDDKVRATLAERHQLAPSDWTMSSYFSIGLLFFYDATKWRQAHPDRDAADAETGFMPPKVLADAFEQLLISYPLLTGRFEMTQDGCAEVVMLKDAGVPFVERECALSLSALPLSVREYTGPTSLPSGLQLISDPEWAVPAWSPTKPAFDVTHTRFACGGVCLGVRMHHWLGDAEAYFGMMADWATIVRGMSDQTGSGSSKPSLSVQPAMDRSFLRPTESQLKEATAPGAFVPEIYRIPPPSTESSASSSSSGDLDATGASAAPSSIPSPPIARTIRFDRSKLESLKASATADGSWVSTFEALAAHIYRSVFRARFPQPDGLIDSKSIDFILAHNYRKMIPECPSRYFGNCALGTLVSMKGSNLRSDSLATTANAVHSAIASLDETNVRRTLAFIAAQPRKDAIPVAPTTALMTITQWNKQPIYSGSVFEGVEEGGRPIRVCLPPGPAFDGMAILFSTEEDSIATSDGSTNGSIDVLISLAGDAMERLLADKEFHSPSPIWGSE